MAIQQMFLGLGAGGYEVERSLRFNAGDSAYITRSVSSTGNRRTWTVSFWMKFCEVTGATNQRLWSNESGDGNGDIFKIEFYGGSNSNRRLAFLDDNHASSGVRFTTNRGFRDPNAWYHIVLAVDTTQSTASNRVKIYVNGEQISEWMSGSEHNHPPNQDYDTCVNLSGESNTWGRSFSFGSSSANYFDGYLAEINFVDGSQLTPSSFAETDTVTGQYKPKKYSGSYGTNGYFLNFSDNSNTTSTTLGKDLAGSNNFTCNNFATTDAVKDTPTNNFCTLNILQGYYSAIGSNTYSEGNLKVVTPNSGTGNVFGNMSFTSGKWYAEAYVSGYSSLERFIVGVSGGVIDTVRAAQNIGTNAGAIDVGYFGQTGVKNVSGSESSYGDTYTVGDIIGVALDLDNRTVNFYKNNTAQGTISIASTGDWAIGTGDTSGGGGSTMVMNFGQDSSFAGAKTAQGNADGNGKGDFYYSPPSGFVAMCSANLSVPTIKKPNQHFDTLLWTGTSASQTLTGLNFQPDWFWAKARSQTYHHTLMDSVRGTNKQLWTNRTNDEQTDANFLTSFNSDGVTLGDNSSGTGATNTNTHTYVGWFWKGGGSAVSNSDGTITSSVSVNASAGFSIVSYTGNGTSGATVGHGLGVAPNLLIVKNRDYSDVWLVGSDQLGFTKQIYLNLTNASATSADGWNNTAPTSSVFSLGNGNATNKSSDEHIAYCFSEVAGFSKFGSYKGNNNSNGPFIYLGFRPALVLIKNREAGSTAWYMLDNKRDPDNPAQQYLAAEDNAAEGTYSFYDFLSNGFKLRNTGSAQNPNGQEIIYLAFAESPFKYSRAR